MFCLFSGLLVVCCNFLLEFWFLTFNFLQRANVVCEIKKALNKPRAFQYKLITFRACKTALNTVSSPIRCCESKMTIPKELTESNSKVLCGSKGQSMFRARSSKSGQRSLTETVQAFENLQRGWWSLCLQKKELLLALKSRWPSSILGEAFFWDLLDVGTDYLETLHSWLRESC